MSILKDLQEAVVNGNAEKTKEYTDKAVAENISVSSILKEGLITGMNVIGVQFKNNEVYVPEVLIAARAMHAGMDVLKPLLTAAGIQEKGIVVIGTVKGDLHDIGKNLVVMMLEGAGYKVIDLGIDVPAETFIEAVEEHQPQIVALSALLTTTMDHMKETVEQLKARNIRSKVIIGGAPVTQVFADEIGADGYAPDAASAADIADELMPA